ncbi:MAG: proline dehydrogenase family protein [Candidatus Neomarinimicrobiota bacterium]|jgi:proline dehydrogenase|uniref:proline dehydrogenase n=1 Tax=marine metagenome TaxID=408172 RepID=A0A381UTG9_9ZZZZ|nr:proline dehydrogenase family protein [Candidatus Neomarinimicrobiota bacterium]|tara:strand:- start:114 stop:1010 length:897 start_codon:yes stop_codon:yes gene_type:complete
MNLLNPIIKATLPLVPKPIVRRIAKPYIAGETLPELVSVVQELNHDRFIVATSILGEFVTEVKDAEEAVQQYQEVLTEIKDLKLESNIHIKLSHFGLKLDKEVCYNNLINILKTAADCGNFVRIDMEDSTCTDDTLAIYKRAREKFENVGVVIQACMKRSNEDIDSLKAMKANVRICKGIYIEPPEIAYNDREIVRQNYSTLLKDLLGAGCYVGIATHDKWLVDDAFQTIEELALDHTQYEFQMLYGVDPQLRQMIRDAGHRMRVAVPFGPSWYPYSIRRLRKNPTVARYVLQALFKK